MRMNLLWRIFCPVKFFWLNSSLRYLDSSITLEAPVSIWYDMGAGVESGRDPANINWTHWLRGDEDRWRWRWKRHGGEERQSWLWWEKSTGRKMSVMKMGKEEDGRRWGMRKIWWRRWLSMRGCSYGVGHWDWWRTAVERAYREKKKMNKYI